MQLADRLSTGSRWISDGTNRPHQPFAHAKVSGAGEPGTSHYDGCVHLRMKRWFFRWTGNLQSGIIGRMNFGDAQHCRWQTVRLDRHYPHADSSEGWPPKPVTFGRKYNVTC